MDTAERCDRCLAPELHGQVVQGQGRPLLLCRTCWDRDYGDRTDRWGLFHIKDDVQEHIAGYSPAGMRVDTGEAENPLGALSTAELDRLLAPARFADMIDGF